MKLKGIVSVILATIASGNSFAAASKECTNAIQTEIHGELRRFSYCETRLDPSTCRVLGERGWYTVSDLKTKKKSLYLSSAVKGIFAIGEGTIAGMGVLSAIPTGGSSLVVTGFFGGVAGVNLYEMTENLDEAAAISFVLGGRKPKCSLLTKTAQSLENVLNEMR